MNAPTLVTPLELQMRSSLYVTVVFCPVGPHIWQIIPHTAQTRLNAPISWTASTSHHLHVTRLIAEGWQGEFSLTIDLYTGSNRTVHTAAAVQMTKLISLSDELTETSE